MVEKINIRSIKKEDLKKLAEIYTEVYRLFDVGEKWTKESSFKLLEYWLNRQKDLCFLAEVENEIVGAFVAGVKPWWDGNHLVDGEIFIHPKFQKRGIGKFLSDFMYKFAFINIKLLDLIPIPSELLPFLYHGTNPKDSKKLMNG
jgi:aminoglycoside 6'-N-acetyltransferase I